MRIEPGPAGTRHRMWLGTAVTLEHDLAILLTRVARCVDRTAALLAQATDLHRELVDLHAEATGAALDLDRMLKQVDASRTPVSGDAAAGERAP